MEASLTSERWFCSALFLLGLTLLGCDGATNGPEGRSVDEGLDRGNRGVDTSLPVLDQFVPDAGEDDVAVTTTDAGPEQDGHARHDQDLTPDARVGADVAVDDGMPERDSGPAIDAAAPDDGIDLLDAALDATVVADANPPPDPDRGVDAHVVEDVNPPLDPDLAVDAGPVVEPDQGIDAAPPPDFPDLALGPYSSLLDIVVQSFRSGAAAYDSRETYGHVASQGYLLQAMGEILWHTRDHAFEPRDEIVATALEEIEELQAVADRVVGGGPAYGLDRAWDAFGDGSENPAFTAYTWQSGTTALGVAKVARYLQHVEHPRAAETAAFGARGSSGPALLALNEVRVPRADERHRRPHSRRDPLPESQEGGCAYREARCR